MILMEVLILKNLKVNVHYPKSIVPMGEIDRIEFLKDIYPLKFLHEATHWFLTIYAPLDKANGFEIAIFPSNQNGLVTKNSKPLFVTNYDMSLEDAITQLFVIEKDAANDTLFKIYRPFKQKLFLSFFKKRRFYFFKTHLNN